MSCLFCQIIDGSIKADVVYDDDQVLAFRDIQPQAPTHILIIPKLHIETLDDAQTCHQALLGHMALTAQALAKQFELDQSGYRTVMNCKAWGGQSVYHLHMHLLGGRALAWPPG